MVVVLQNQWVVNHSTNNKAFQRVGRCVYSTDGTWHEQDSVIVSVNEIPPDIDECRYMYRYGEFIKFARRIT